MPVRPPVRRPFLAVAFAVALPVLAGGPAGAFAADLDPPALRDIDQKIRRIARDTLPGTVALVPGGPAKEYGTGSGVIVSPEGLILTAAHVTMGMNDKVTVIFPDGKRASGKVLGMDFTRDAAMVQITDPGTYPHVPLGDSAGLKPNDWCVALGHSGGFDRDRTPPVRLGRVIEHDPKAFLMTDSTLIGGDSGGPLFDIQGRLIGIHSNIGFSLSQNNHVPIAVFHENWDRLKAGERYGGQEEGGLLANPERPMIGAELEDVPGDPGVRIREVFPRSPAAKAGLKPGHTVLKAGDVAVGNREALIAEIAKRKPGDDLPLTVMADGAEREVTVRLVAAGKLRPPRESRSRPEAPEAPKPAAPSDKAAQLARFEEKLRASIESGTFQMSPEDVEIFESPEAFKSFMDTFKKSLQPAELKALNDLVRPSAAPPPVAPGVHDPDRPAEVEDAFIRTVLQAFRPSVAKASRATHLVFRGTEWKSLCTVVHPDGFAITKASEIETRNNQALTVMLAKDRQVPAEVVKTFPKQDLALLRLKGVADLPAVAWGGDAAPGSALALGGLIGAAGSGPDAVAIGVVSVLPRSLAAEAGGFLAIGTAPHDKGVLVTMVMPGGAAAKAGMKKGDVITRAGGVDCDTPETLIRKVKGTDPGSELVLDYLRGDTAASVRVKLGDRSTLDTAMGDPNAKMNRMGTELSERRTGYERALQTDLPIRPEECGGPVVDLGGKVVAITIARAGRTATYALLAEDVRRLVEPEIASRLAPGAEAAAASPE